MMKLNFWPNGIIIILFLFISAGIGYVIFSGYHRVDLVTSDYYAQELKYQNQIDRIERTRKLKDPITSMYDRKKKQIILQAPAGIPHDDISGRIVFFRPSDKDLDREWKLRFGSDALQYIDAAGLAPGFWRIQIFWSWENKEYFNQYPLQIH